MNESEVTQMLHDAINQDPEGRVWHVNTKHLMTFAQMVADKTKRELESSPEEFSSWVKFYEDRIAHLDEMLVKSMDMNRELMEKLSGDNELIEHFEERRRKADEAAWAEGRIQCAAVRDVRLDEAGEDSRSISKVYSDYVAACLAIDDRRDAARAKREAWERRLNSQRVEKEDQEKWDEYIYEQGEVKEDQKKADEAAWANDENIQNVCNTHPNAPHGFLRNASHNAGRYVCECEHWEEPK